MTTEDPIAKYQDALTALAAAEREADGLAQVVVAAGLKLRGWRGVGFSNGKPPVSFPPDVLRADSINVSDFPTGQQLAEALASWHQAKHAAQNAFGQVPRDRRVGLQEPPR